MAFWQVILILCMIASCFFVLPLLRRYESDEPGLASEGKRFDRIFSPKNVKSRLLLIFLALLLPVASLVYYHFMGQKTDWKIHQLLEKSGSMTKQDRQDLYAMLQKRTKQTPKNVQAGYVLANMATANQNTGEAIHAYRQILIHKPESPDVMADLAKVLFAQSDNVINPEIKRLITQALALDDKNADALGLAGVAAFQTDDYNAAINYWKRALATFRPNSPSAQAIEQALIKAEVALQARGKLKKKKPAPKASVVKEAAVKKDDLSQIVKSGASDKSKQKAKLQQEKEEETTISISLKVSLDEKVRVPDDAVVFIYARAWRGPKMPLAIKRVTVAQLPMDITLDNSMAMAPGMNLSSFNDIELVARVSKSGNALAKKGDWQATSGKRKIDSLNEAVTLIINKQVK